MALNNWENLYRRRDCDVSNREREKTNQHT